MNNFWRRAKPLIWGALCVVVVLVCSPLPNFVSYAISTHNVAPIWVFVFHPYTAWLWAVAQLGIVIISPIIFLVSWKLAQLRLLRVYALIMWPLSWGLCASFVGANGGWDERRAGLITAATRAQLLIDAIETYRADNSAMPAELSELVPQHIAAIPSTGMTAYPQFYYLSAAKRGEGSTFQSYELGVQTPFGLSFDRFYYWPENNYPQFSRSGRIERVNNWAYLHE